MISWYERTYKNLLIVFKEDIMTGVLTVPSLQESLIETFLPIFGKQKEKGDEEHWIKRTKILYILFIDFVYF